MASTLPVLSYAPLVRASSVDTQQRLSYNPHRTYPKKPEESLSSTTSTASSTNRNHTNISISDLLKRNAPINKQVELGDTYMGYERWLPSPPKVEKPRSMFNASSLAYIGDCIYELYARRHFLLPPLNIEEYNDRVMAVVRCEAQDAMLQKLINDNYLSQEERDVLRWGRNIGSAKTRTKKRAGVAVYNRASSLETLVGYLYLTNVQRLEEIMVKLGFSADASTQLMEEKSNSGEDSHTSLRHNSEILPSSSAKWDNLFSGENEICEDKSGSGQEEKKRKKKRAKKKRPDPDDEAKKEVDELVCLYPFTKSSSATQRKIKLQYDQLVKSQVSNAITPAQVGQFITCLIEVKDELQHKSEVVKRKFTITKALLCKADRSSFDRLCQQIFKLQLEQKRLEEDAFVYNWLQQKIKHLPAYKKMLELGACMDMKANSGELVENTDADLSDISFEELLAQEKKDVFWQRNGRFKACTG